MGTISQPALIAQRGRATKAVPSDALVFFGATGDLAYKKIFPALQHMIRRGNLEVPVIGIAKSGWTIEQLRERARESLKQHGGGVDEAAFAKLVPLLQYVDGDYQDPTTFTKLRQALGSAGAGNYLRFRLSPEISLTLGARIKRPGATMAAMPVELSVVEHPQGDELDAYERLLSDAMRGEALLFVRQDAVDLCCGRIHNDRKTEWSGICLR
jgi:glucose-6-phosphate 1-dehydrogenase